MLHGILDWLLLKAVSMSVFSHVRETEGTRSPSMPLSVREQEAEHLVRPRLVLNPPREPTTALKDEHTSVDVSEF